MSFSHTESTETKPNDSLLTSLGKMFWGSKNPQTPLNISTKQYPETITDEEDLFDNESSSKELNLQTPKSPNENGWEVVSTPSSITNNPTSKETSALSTSESSEEMLNKTSLLKSISSDTSNTDNTPSDSAPSTFKQETQNEIQSLEKNTNSLVDSYEKLLAENKTFKDLLDKGLLRESDIETKYNTELSLKNNVIESLNSKIETLQIQNKNYQEEQNQTAEKLTNELITAGEAKVSIENELNTLANKKTELETLLEKISAEKAILQISLDKEKLTNVELQQQLQKEKSLNDKRNMSLEEAIASKNQMERSLNAEAALKKELQQLLDTEISARKELQELLEQETSLKDEFKKSLEKAISSKENLEKSFQAERENHQENLKEIENRVILLQVNLEASMLFHEKNEKKLQENNESLQKETVALTESYKNIAREKEQLERSLKIYTISRDKLKNKLRELKKAVTFIQEMKETYTDLYHQQRDAYLQCKNEIEKLSKTHEVDKDKLAELSKNNKKYKEKHVELSQLNAELATKLETAKKELSSSIAIAKESQLEAKNQSTLLDERTNQLQAAEDKANELTKSIARLKIQVNEISNLQHTIWSLKTTNSILNEDKNNNLETIDKVKDELAKTKNQLAIEQNEKAFLLKDIETLKQTTDLLRIESLSQQEQIKHLQKLLQEKQRDENNITVATNHVETIATKQNLEEEKNISIVKNPVPIVTPPLTIAQDEKNTPLIGNPTSIVAPRLTYSQALQKGVLLASSVFKQPKSSPTSDQAHPAQDQETQKKPKRFSCGSLI